MARDEQQKSEKELPGTFEAEVTPLDESEDSDEVCIKAPEWAEHQRLRDEDTPCDDGRSGRLSEESDH
ncbi:MAG: hypothetical protein P8010_00470 [Desulfosarcinaceae bacterium]